MRKRATIDPTIVIILFAVLICIIFVIGIVCYGGRSESAPGKNTEAETVKVTPSFLSPPVYFPCICTGEMWVSHS